jgi:hypothetical protein
MGETISEQAVGRARTTLQDRWVDGFEAQITPPRKGERDPADFECRKPRA